MKSLDQKAAEARERLRKAFRDPLGTGNRKKQPSPWYNSVLVLAGLWQLTDQWGTFFGYLLIAEAFLWTIEHAGQWRDE